MQDNHDHPWRWNSIRNSDLEWSTINDNEGGTAVVEEVHVTIDGNVKVGR